MNMLATQPALESRDFTRVAISDPEGWNVFKVGQTRSGKSESEKRDFVEYVSGESVRGGNQGRRRPGILIDPHGRLARSVAEELTARRMPFIYLDLKNLDHRLGFNLIEPSKKSGEAAQAENDEQIRWVAYLFTRRRDLNLPHSPLIEEWTIGSLEFLIYQERPLPLLALPFLLMPKHPLFQRALMGCTRDDLYWKFEQLTRFSAIALRAEVGPALRLIYGTFKSPAFQCRCGGTFNLGDFLDDGGILLVDGSSDGTLSDDAARTMMRAINMLAVRHAMTRENGPRFLLSTDEIFSADLAGPVEATNLMQTQKFGVDNDNLAQSLSGIDPLILDAYLTNHQRLEFFRGNSPQTVRLQAEILATPMLDPYMVHHTDTRFRQYHGGYEEERSISRSYTNGGEKHETIHEGTRSRPRYGFEAESTNHYQGLNDQILLMMKELMNLRVGERFVRHLTVFKEYVPLLRDPYPMMPGLGRIRTDKEIERTWQDLTAYRSTGLSDLQALLDSCGSTRPRSSTSSKPDTSAAMRLRQGGFNGRRNGNK